MDAWPIGCSILYAPAVAVGSMEPDPNETVYPVGCYADEDAWSIRVNERFGAKYHEACPHATVDGDDLVIPRVVEGRNEGGYCSVHICLDCILEAVK